MMIDKDEQIRQLKKRLKHLKEQQHHSQQLTQQSDIFLTVLQHIPEALLLLNKHSQIIFANKGFEQLFGYNFAELKNHTPNILQSHRHNKIFYKRMWQRLEYEHVWQGQIWNKHKNGSIHPTWLHITCIKNKAQKTTHYLGVYTDFSSQDEQQRRLHILNYYDPLTGLPNIHLLHDRLAQALSQAQRHGYKVAILYLNLDNFSMVNDAFGHSAGDLLLQKVALRLQKTVRLSDSICRPQNDEFIILLPAVQTLQNSERVARNIIDSMNKPLTLENQEYYISSSIGISHYPIDSENADNLIPIAKKSMQKAKESGGNTFI